MPSILFYFFFTHQRLFLIFFLSHFKVLSSGGRGEWGAWAWGGVGGSILSHFSILNALEMQVHPCSSNFLITLGKCIHVVVIS